MTFLLGMLIFAGAGPIGVALWARQRTSLVHALAWALVAQFAWGFAFLAQNFEAARYCALALTGCAGVAILGARRPHVFAWNFVVIGLFAVLLLPIVETHLIGAHSFDGLRVLFLAGAIGVSIVNYLPTRLGPAAFFLAIACGGEITAICAPTWLPDPSLRMIFGFLLGMVPWIAWICVFRQRALDTDRSEFDRLWLSFRDSWGLVWSQRAREQFNNAAEHASWPSRLAWHGLVQELDAPADEAKMAATLRATLQRFL